MIILLGFKDYDDFDLEFMATEVDAVRIANLVGAPGTRTNAVAYVTILPRGLDNDDATRYPSGTTGARAGEQTTFDGWDQT